MLSKISQRKTTTVISLLYVESKKLKQMNINRNKLLDTENKPVVTSREKSGRRSKIGEGNQRNKLLGMK